MPLDLIPVQPNSTPSIRNSTSIPLGAGAQWDGDWDDTSAINSVHIAIYIDVPGTLIVDHSYDGEIVHQSIATPFPAMSSPTVTFAPKRLRFTRFHFINGSTPQNIFQLAVTYEAGATNGQILPATFPMTDNVPLQHTRALLTSKAPDLTYKNIAITNLGELQTVSNLARPAGSSISSVSASLGNVTLLASNSSRLGATVYNDSSDSLFLKFGAISSLANFSVKLKPQSYLEFPIPCYTGRVDGIWDGTNGSAKITEFF